MAKKVTPSKPQHSCQDCKHATDFHSKALDGHWILCKCSFHKYSKFLTRDHCEHFSHK